MANVTTKQIVRDGPRNAVVVLSGVLDTSDASLTPALSLTDFSNNDGTLTGFRVDEIEFSVSDPLKVKLYWNATTPQLFASLAQSGEFCFKREGGILPDATAAGYDGGLNLTTSGWSASLVLTYTVKLNLVKLY